MKATTTILSLPELAIQKDLKNHVQKLGLVFSPDIVIVHKVRKEFLFF
jgi:hypothetical protein